MNVRQFIRSNLVLVLIVLLTLLVVALYAIFIKDASLSGDENYYFRTALTIKSLLLLFFTDNWSDSSSLLETLVGKGWFMPGSSFQLLPFTFGDPSVSRLRIGNAIFNLGLTGIIAHQIKNLFGNKYACLFFILGIIFPSYILLSFTFWGESTAGRLVCILMLYLLDKITFSKIFSVKNYIFLGSLLAWIIYIRPSYIFIAPCTILIILCNKNVWKNDLSALSSCLKLFLVPSIVVLLFLSPWSLLVSSKYGDLILTTNTTNFRFMGFMDDDDKTKYLTGKNKTKKNKVTWKTIHNYYLKKANNDFTRYNQFVKKDKKRVLESKSWTEYSKSVFIHFRVLFLAPNSFPNRILRLCCKQDNLVQKLKYGLLRFNSFFWYSLIIGTCLFALITHGNQRYPNITIISMFFMLAITIQPFVAMCNARHGTGLISIYLVNITFLIYHLYENDMILEKPSSFEIMLKMLGGFIVSFFFIYLISTAI